MPRPAPDPRRPLAAPLRAALASALVASGLATVATLAGPLPPASAATTTVSSKVVSIDSSNSASALLTSNGDVYTWGDNLTGVTGLGLTSGYTPTPTKVPTFTQAGEKVVEMSLSGLTSTSSQAFTLARTSTGRVFAWGSNANGSLGNGTTADAAVPTLVTPTWGSDLPVLVKTAARTGVAVTQSGRIYVWGDNETGTAGGPTTADVLVPTLFSLGGGWTPSDPVVQVEGGTSWIGALTQSGRLFLWGSDSRGVRGRNNGTTSATFGPTPNEITLPVATGDRIVGFGGTTSTAGAITQSGRVFNWGFASGSRQGNNSPNSSDVLVPTEVTATMVDSGDRPVDFVHGGNANITILLTQQGHLYVAGQDSGGTLGLDKPQGPGTPAQYALTYTKVPTWPGRPANDPIIEAGGASSKAYAVTASGRAYAWGNDGSGGGIGLGGYTGTSVSTPQATPALLATPPAGTAPTITGAGTALGTVGSNFIYAPTIAGDPAPTLSVSGTVPPGTGFDSSTGAVYGTASTAGTYRFTITATNAAGSATKQVDVRIDSAFTGLSPTVSGTPNVGQTLTASPGSSFAPNDANTVLLYQWQRIVGSTPVNISSATRSTYDAVAADQNNRLRVLVTALRDGYTTTTRPSGETGVVGTGTFTIGAPTISNSPVVGSTLTCTAPGDTPGTVTYAWTRGATVLANRAFYTPVASDRGSVLTCTATSVRAGYADATASTNTPPIGTGTFTIGPPTITPSPARVGQTLTCTPAAGSVGLFTYTWSGGAGTASTAQYTPVPADVGNVITCSVRAERDGYADATNQSSTAPVARGTFTIGAPTISGGPATFGQQLTCAAANGTPGSATYVWERGAATVGSTATYTPGLADVGSALTCTVTVTRSGYQDAVASSTTAPVAKAVAPIGAPTITGQPARVGKQLTCAPAPGTPGSIFFAWLRGSTPLSPGPTYTPVAADLGQPISCRVRSVRDGYEDADATATTDPVYDPTFTASPPTFAPAGLVVDRTTTCLASTPADAYSYSWTRGGSVVSTASTYTPTPTDAGQVVRCTVTHTRAGYDPATSSVEATVARAVFTVSPPVITGTAQVGRTLTCTPADDPGALVSIEWLVPGSPRLATGATYELPPATVGAPVECRVTRSRPGYEDAASSRLSGTVLPGSFTVGTPVITGVAAVGRTLTCAVPSGTPGTPVYTWRRGTTTVGSGADYTAVPADQGLALTCTAVVTRTGYDPASTTATSDPIARGVFAFAPPTITGTAQVGRTLACVAPAGTPGTLSYAWTRVGERVGTGASYDVQPADVGAGLTCTVTSQRTGYVDASNQAMSPVVQPGVFSVAAPQVVGVVAVGRTVTCTPAATSDPLTYRYQWSVDGDVVGTGADYLLTPDDLGSDVVCLLTASRAGYQDATNSAGRGPVVPGTFAIGAPTITGVAAVGRTLTCAAPAGTPGTLTYAWTRPGSVGATGDTYEVQADDLGSQLTCTVTSTRAGYQPAANLAASPVVALGTFAVAAPTVSGDAQVGRTLTCAAPSGPGTPAYSWLRGTSVVGSDSSYDVAPADLGEVLTCVLTVARTGYTDATSRADAPTVAAGVFTVAAPDVSGDVRVGRTLTCAAPAGPGTPAYSWVRGTTVVGSGASYDVVPADLDSVLTCVLTVSRDGYVDATSRADSAVVVRGTFIEPSPTVTGLAKVGERQLCGRTDHLRRADLVGFAWLRGTTVVGDGASYVATPADLGLRLTCRITVVRDGYVDAVSTASTDVVGLGSFAVDAPSVDGDAVVGEPMTCVAAPGTPGDLSFAWYDGEALVGEDPVHVPAVSELGDVLTCVVTSTRAGYVDATSTVDTAPVAAAAAGTWTPTITGTVQVGRRLTASLVEVVPDGTTVAWAWSVGGRPVPGATGSTYRLTQADYGKRVAVRAVVAEPGHVEATVVSAPTVAVALRPMRFSLSATQLRLGQLVKVTATHLRPGQPWVVRFGNGTVIARGVVGSREQVVRNVRIPTSAGTRLMRVIAFETRSPHRIRRAGVVIR